MNGKVTTRIDPAKCNGCGMCVRVCPASTLSMRSGKAVVTGKVSLGCGHCKAVCPTGAVEVDAIDGSTLQFTNFEFDSAWLPPGQTDIPHLARLMASRRSCRNYREKEVPRSLLEDLVKLGITAPSGTNSQLWTFTIVPGRKAVVEFGTSVLRFFKRLNRLAANPLLRRILKLFGKGELDSYYRLYYNAVKKAVLEWEQSGRDRLFHGAPSAIVIATKPGAACPKEDALLATQNILLASHSFGLGTCLIGFAVEAAERDRNIKPGLGIPESETVNSVIAIGYPAESYARAVGRKKTEIRWV